MTETPTPHATYTVTGMTCGGCVRALTATLERALPGAVADVALEGGRVTVTGLHSPEAVARAVDEAGFELVVGP